MKARLARASELDGCMRLRHEVFVRGQGVPVAIEQDGRDGDAVHFVATVADEIVGTARMRMIGDAAKAERVAVRDAYRGGGGGVALMRALEDEATRRGLSRVVLHAQEAVIPFYEQLGYGPVGDRFVEAGIVHLEMHKALSSRADPG